MTKEALDSIQKEMQEKTGTLYLNHMQLTEVPQELSGMVWLQELDLSENYISEIKGLKALTSLQRLNLSFNHISEIKGLEALTGLKLLNLRQNEIREIEGLEALRSLEGLELSKNRISEIKGLKALTSLYELHLVDNRISEIKGLEALRSLEGLDLSENQISEIKGLEALTGLKWLDLRQNEISAIKGLEALTDLHKLILSNNPVSRVTKLKKLISMPNLGVLYLYGIRENNLHIPVEKFGTLPGENCLQLLKDYFEAIQEGAAHSKQVPVILIGNSTAGKTSLRFFLKDKVYPPPKEWDCSTHGIEPDVWQPPQELLEEYMPDDALKEARIFFWDFGGQEYYHATHRLFLIKEAVYVLVWEKNTNKQGYERIKIRLKRANGVIEEVEQPVELFPYAYWLKTIRFFAPDPAKAPIVMVQNKLDEAGHQKEYPDSQLPQQYSPSDVFHLSLKEADATRPKGNAYHDYEGFLRCLLTLAKNHLTNTARETHWEPIIHLLQQHKEEKIWSPQEFLAHAQQEVDPNIHEGSLNSYMHSLHSNGFIFHFADDNTLKDHVFINPGWVVEMIYAILDETVLQNRGEFNREHVKAKIGAEDPEAGDPEVLVALMKKFELVFENPETDKLIAPQYLPEQLSEKPSARGAWNALKARFQEFAHPHFYLRFPDFLPPSIMLRFLSAYGPRAIGQNYWKNGIAFMLEKREVVVMADYEQRLFKVFVEGGDKYVQRLVFDTLHELTGNNEQVEIGVTAEELVRFSELKTYWGKSQVVKSVSGDLVACALFHHFVEDIETLREKERKPMEPANRQVKIFVSYAHEDDEVKNLLVNTHLKAIQNHYDENLLAWTDAGIKPGSNWDAKIKREMENADIIIFLITNSFLASDYIKNTEIKNALERFKQGRQIIVPIYIEDVSKRLLPFKEKQYLPSGVPLEDWEQKNKAWVKIQDGIITLIDDIKAGNTSEYFE